MTGTLKVTGNISKKTGTEEKIKADASPKSTEHRGYLRSLNDKLNSINLFNNSPWCPGVPKVIILPLSAGDDLDMSY